VKLSLSVWPVHVRKKRKRQEGRKSHKKCIFHVCVEQPLAGGFQTNLANVLFHGRNQTCKVSSL